MAERLASAAALRSAAPSRPSPSGRPAARANSAFFPSSSSSSPSPALPRVSLRAAPSRLPQKAGSGRSVRCMAAAASGVAQLKAAREDIRELLKTTHCHPILVRLGWHDAGTYDKNIEAWPQRGGANGSLRFDVELKHGANAGLINALKLIQPIKDKYPSITHADIFQLASATAIEEAGGPKIPMKYGRVDVTGPEQCPPEGKLPDAGPSAPADHLREKNGPGAPGGQSWTADWLKFDNSYFKEIKEKRDQDLLVLPTDAALFEDPAFKVYAEKYAEDEEALFKDYAKAHAKLSNLGAKFNPPEGFSLDD